MKAGLAGTMTLDGAGEERDRLRHALCPRVLLVQFAADLSGSTISGELLARGFRNAGWPVDVAFGAEGPGVARYQALGCRVHKLPHKNWLRGGNVVQSIRRIAVEVAAARSFARLFRECVPDVVYVNSLASLGAAVAARRLRVPCVWHIRELFEDVGGEMRIPPLGGKAAVRWVVRRLADQIVLISRAVQENVLGDGNLTRVSIVPNAVDDEFFSLPATRDECRAVFGLPVNFRLVGVPGTLRPMKGHEFLLKAAARVLAADPNCLFALTGDGETNYVGRLRNIAAELGLASRLHFLGTVRDMPRFYRACDVICVPSRAEPFGRTVIEAFAAGTPVIASAVGGIRETVEHARNGWLVDYDDVDALSSGIRKLLEDEALRRRLASTARSVALERYSAKVYHERINGIVQQALKARR